MITPRSLTKKDTDIFTDYFCTSINNPIINNPNKSQKHRYIKKRKRHENMIGQLVYYQLYQRFLKKI